MATAGMDKGVLRLTSEDLHEGISNLDKSAQNKYPDDENYRGSGFLLNVPRPIDVTNFIVDQQMSAPFVATELASG